MEHSGWGWRPLAATKAWSYRLGPRAQVCVCVQLAMQQVLYKTPDSHATFELLHRLMIVNARCTQWLGASRSRLVYNDRACAANATSDQLCRWLR